jgi:hypothetical protein
MCVIGYRQSKMCLCLLIVRSPGLDPGLDHLALAIRQLYAGWHEFGGIGGRDPFKERATGCIVFQRFMLVHGNASITRTAFFVARVAVGFHDLGDLGTVANIGGVTVARTVEIFFVVIVTSGNKDEQQKSSGAKAKECSLFFHEQNRGSQ